MDWKRITDFEPVSGYPNRKTATLQLLLGDAEYEMYVLCVWDNDTEGHSNTKELLGTLHRLEEYEQIELLLKTLKQHRNVNITFNQSFYDKHTKRY